MQAEGYDGDGENDMPGLKIPIKYWQIINEPDIKEDPYVIFFVGNERDYFEVLKESCQTIKQVCLDIANVHFVGVGFGVEESAPFGEYSAEYKGIAELCPKAQ